MNDRPGGLSKERQVQRKREEEDAHETETGGNSAEFTVISCTANGELLMMKS